MKTYKGLKAIQRMLDGHIITLKGQENTVGVGLLRKYKNGSILSRSMRAADRWSQCRYPVEFYLNNEFVDYIKPMDYDETVEGENYYPYIE